MTELEQKTKAAVDAHEDYLNARNHCDDAAKHLAVTTNVSREAWNDLAIALSAIAEEQQCYPLIASRMAGVIVTAAPGGN